MYGTQTRIMLMIAADMFENDVKMYGTQTFRIRLIMQEKFENDVKMYGTQTRQRQVRRRFRLRMM